MQVGRAESTAPHGGVAGPRSWLVHGAFGILLVADVVLRSSEGRLDLVSLPVLACVLVAVLVVVVVEIDPPTYPAGHLVAWVAGADIVLVGLSMASSGTTATAALAVLPAMWMGVRYGLRGAVASVVAVGLLVVAVPVLLDPGADAGVVVDLVPLVLLCGVASAAVGALTQAARGASERSEEGAAALDTILGTVDVGLAVLDAEGRLITQNHFHETVIEHAHPHGYPGVRRGVAQYGYAEDGVTPLAHDRRPTVRAARGEELDDYRIWVGASPDTRMALSVSTRNVLDNQGRRIGTVVATRDVTAFMRALQAREQFVSRASHELQTPLASILGYLHLLGSRPDLPDDALEDLAAVSRSADRLARQVADLVHAAASDRARMPLTRRVVALDDLVCTTGRSLQPMVAEHDMTLHVETHDRINADVDPARVEELVRLLVEDAVERSAPGERLHLVVDLDGAAGEITLADDGSGPGPAPGPAPSSGTTTSADGPPPEVPGAADRATQWAGWVLPERLERCREIAEAHGGRLATERDAGRGGAVRVRLPLGVPHPAGT